ncbi:MAG: hypothetical protein LBR79_07015 [Oscillospiraceae bacterium]|jgi:hypothetical protein|nr:hypothetical protein [Oscillospiraceae bacterium]
MYSVTPKDRRNLNRVGTPQRKDDGRMGVTKLAKLVKDWETLKKQDKNSQVVKQVGRTIPMIAAVKQIVCDTRVEITEKVNTIQKKIALAGEALNEAGDKWKTEIHLFKESFLKKGKDLESEPALKDLWRPGTHRDTFVWALGRWIMKDEKVLGSYYDDLMTQYKYLESLAQQTNDLNEAFDLLRRDEWHAQQLPANWKTDVLDKLAEAMKILKDCARRKHHHTGLTEEQEKLISAKKALVQFAIEIVTKWQAKYAVAFKLLKKSGMSEASKDVMKQIFEAD